MNPKLSIAILLVVTITGIFSFPATDHEAKKRPKRFNCNVGIVGGGISGLYMAYRLLKSEKETRVCIFEKDSRVGGRIHDFRFKQAPDIHVAPEIAAVIMSNEMMLRKKYIGLGAWRVDEKQDNMIDLMDELSVRYADWPFVEPNLFESRGIKTNNPEEIKQAYPSLLAHPVFGNMTNGELFGYLLEPDRIPKAKGHATAKSYASDLITAEGQKYLSDLSFHKGEFTSFVSPESFIEFFTLLEKLSGKYVRPKGGMSTIVLHLRRAVEALGGKIFLNTQVKSLSRTRNNKWFTMETSKGSITTNKLIITATPEQVKKIGGSIARRIQEAEQFKSIQPIPAFKGAAVYEHAWWEDLEVAGTRIKAGQRYYSNSNCIGLSLTHRGKGLNGEAVLHTMYNDGECAKRWDEIANMDKNYIDLEVHRALETKYGTKIPKPLDTSYQFWDSAWHFQKAGTSFTMVDISNWAKRPLKGLDVFLVGEAYNPMRAWCEGAVLSGKNALQEGWGIGMNEKGGTSARSKKIKKDHYKKVVHFKGVYDLF